jgi:hypothetical protein
VFFRMVFSFEFVPGLGTTCKIFMSALPFWWLVVALVEAWWYARPRPPVEQQARSTPSDVSWYCSCCSEMATALLARIMAEPQAAIGTRTFHPEIAAYQRVMAGDSARKSAVSEGLICGGASSLVPKAEVSAETAHLMLGRDERGC